MSMLLPFLLFELRIDALQEYQNPSRLAELFDSFYRNRTRAPVAYRHLSIRLRSLDTFHP